MGGRQLGSLRLRVELGPISPVGARYFQVFLEEPERPSSKGPALRGLYHTGSQPAYNWLDVWRLDLEDPSLEEALLRALADLLPPGGHLMAEYESQPETQRSLDLGVPPVATPLGSLLWRVGCGASFKDWYFAEGWAEGPRKLQGYKALDPAHARRRAHSMAEELLDFLSRPSGPGDDAILEPARRRAVEVLEGLETGDEELRRRIEGVRQAYLRVRDRES